jgi:hypothetical protein
LLISTGTALLVAAAILITIVLPAEFGVDPTRIGGMLRLTSMAAVKAAQSPAQVMYDHPTKFRMGKVEIRLKGREELEYKATLPQGEPMLYSWTVQGGAVYSEFHGEPTQGEWPEGFFQSYRISERSEQEHGSFIAPFTGKHGWYWRNLGDEPITIVLEVHGYYSTLGRVGSSSAL